MVFLIIFIGSGAFGAQVQMKSLGYSPKQVEISVGESVTWKNVAYTQHSATSDNKDPGFDTGMVSPGKESKPIKFSKPGSFSYHCSLMESP